MAFRAFLDGWHRVTHAPALLLGVFALTFVMALPLAIVMRSLVAAGLGGSLTANAVADGVDNDWWQEFSAQATGLATTFTPSIIGFAAVLENVGGLLDRQARVAPIVSALVAYVAAWIFVSGGIVDRYARQRRLGAHGFFAACGANFFRLLRLGVLAALVYGFLFAYVHDWLFAGWFTAFNRELAEEGTAIAARFFAYGVFGLLLIATNLVFDFAKVRLVVEDRRSALFAVVAALGFLKRNGGQAVALYALNALTFLAVLAVWLLVAPGVSGVGIGMWAVFLAGQMYLAVRLAVKLQFVASETALFQRLLAHAAYAAAPKPEWPEPPVVEEVVRSA